MNIDAVHFLWDENKNRANIVKHGISFEEAKEAFRDDYSIILKDTEHSFLEERYILLGMTGFGDLLVVVHCSYENNVIRIISARKATRKEENDYYGFEE